MRDFYELSQNQPLDFENVRKLSWGKIVEELKKNKSKQDNKIVDVKSIKIKSITLTNIKLFEDLTIEFDKSVCFIGHNGCGKAAILRSLALALAFKPEYLIDETYILGNDFVRVSEYDYKGKPVYKESAKILVKFLVNNEEYTASFINQLTF